MARLVLISCPSIDFLYAVDAGKRKRFPHLGLLYLGTYAQNEGHEVKTFDLWQKGLTWQPFIDELDRFDPQIIGFNVHTEAYGLSLDLSKRLKQRYPGAKVVWGGAFPTFTFEEMLQNRCIDFVGRFEGERVLSNLLRHTADPRAHPVESIAGLAYRRDGAVIANPREKPIADLDGLPYPDRDLASFDEYELLISISSTRGCPGDCIFCAARAYWSSDVRFRSAESIFQEVMAQYEKYGFLEFVIIDDTFTALPGRTEEFCRRLRETGIPFSWSCESRADVVTGELLETMYEAGCREIQFGIESSSPEILRRLGKGVTLDQITDAFRLAHEIGFHGIGSFILGHPWDTVDTMKKTLDFVCDLRDKYTFTWFNGANIPFPGCYQYENAEKLGIKIHAKHWDDFRLNNAIISTPTFSVDDLREILFYSYELSVARYVEPSVRTEEP